MINAIIADDEKLDRIGLNMQVDWYLFDIEIVGLAEDGFEALEILESINAQLLITDVKMPGMSGHELIEKAKAFNPDIQVIFISGYDDFEYIKKALQLEAAEYILKPVNTEELIAALERVVNRINSKQKDQVVKDKLDESASVIRTKLLKDLTYGTINITTIEETIQRWELQLLNKTLLTSIVELEYRDNKTVNHEEMEGVIGDFVKDEANLFIGISLTYFIDETNRIIVIISSDHKVDAINQKEMSRYLKKFYDTLQEELNCIVTMAVGDIVYDCVDISKSYNNAAEKILLKMIYGKGHIFDELLTASQRIDNGIISKIVNEISESIYNCDEMKMNHLVNYMFEHLKENKIYKKTFIQDVCLNLIGRVQITICDRNISFEQIFGSNTILWEKLLKFDTIVDIRQWIKNILKCIISYMTDIEQSNEHMVINSVINEVRHHYMFPLTLKEIAGKLGYSPNHLGFIFKREMNRGFNDFLIEYRMKKAVDYLKDPRIKLYEVALNVSYKNVNAFTSQFKKYFDISPKEYRRKYLIH